MAMGLLSILPTVLVDVNLLVCCSVVALFCCMIHFQPSLSCWIDGIDGIYCGTQNSAEEVWRKTSQVDEPMSMDPK